MPPNHVPPGLLLDGSVAFARIGDASVIVTAIPRWTPSLAERLIEETLAAAGSPPAQHLLIRHLAGNLDASSRRRAQEVMDRRVSSDSWIGERRLAAIVGSAFERGAVTAWRWLTGDPVHAFAPERIDEAACFVAGDAAAAGLVAAAHADSMRLLTDAVAAAKAR